MTATHSVAAEFVRSDPLAASHPGRAAPNLSKVIRPGECIFSRGDNAVTIYRIERGAVRVYRISSDGHRQILAFHVAGEWFGLEGGIHHENYADALCETYLQPLSTPKATSSSPINLLDISLRNLTLAYDRQALIVRPTAVARVAGFIEQVAGKSAVSSEFELMMSRTDIADYLGLTVESVARAFTKLSSLRAIRIDGRRSRHVRVLNFHKLAAAGR